MQTFLQLYSKKHKNSETEKRTRFVQAAESIGTLIKFFSYIMFLFIINYYNYIYKSF